MLAEYQWCFKVTTIRTEYTYGHNVYCFALSLLIFQNINLENNKDLEVMIWDVSRILTRANMLWNFLDDVNGHSLESHFLLNTSRRA